MASLQKWAKRPLRQLHFSRASSKRRPCHCQRYDSKQARISSWHPQNRSCWNLLSTNVGTERNPKTRIFTLQAIVTCQIIVRNEHKKATLRAQRSLDIWSGRILLKNIRILAKITRWAYSGQSKTIKRLHVAYQKYILALKRQSPSAALARGRSGPYRRHAIPLKFDGRREEVACHWWQGMQRIRGLTNDEWVQQNGRHAPKHWVKSTDGRIHDDRAAVEYSARVYA